MNYIITSDKSVLRLRAGQLRNCDWTPVRVKGGVSTPKSPDGL